jgi:hypothetical protein
VAEQEFAQGAQRRQAPPTDVIAVGDQHRIALVPRRRGWLPGGRCGGGQFGKSGRPSLAVRSVDFTQPLTEPIGDRCLQVHDAFAAYRFSIPVMLVIKTRSRRRRTV